MLDPETVQASVERKTGETTPTLCRQIHETFKERRIYFPGLAMFNYSRVRDVFNQPNEQSIGPLWIV
jgi:hypothetical protein